MVLKISTKILNYPNIINFYSMVTPLWRKGLEKNLDHVARGHVVETLGCLCGSKMEADRECQGASQTQSILTLWGDKV